MSEEKQFEPTQSRLEKAKREGDVARSQEIGNVASFAAGLVATSAVLVPLAGSIRSVLISSVAGNVNLPALCGAAVFMLLPVGAAACAAILAGIVQSGGVRVVALRIRPERLSPPENLKRMFSKESAVTAARASIAFVCAGGAIVPAFLAMYAAAFRSTGVQSLATAAWSGALRTAGTACAVAALFAGADYGLQRMRRRNRLRMSYDELKRDQKEQDGDPLARSRRRALHRQFARGSLQRVKDAAFLVTNPTHIAIALEYRPPSVAVPRVLVRAADDAAARVREIAAAQGIPTVEDVTLARTLYANARAGESIPQQTYVAVAEIVAALTKTGVLGA